MSDTHRPILWPILWPTADRPGTGRIARIARIAPRAHDALARLLRRPAATENAEPAAATDTPQPWPSDPPHRPVISRYY